MLIVKWAFLKDKDFNWWIRQQTIYYIRNLLLKLVQIITKWYCKLSQWIKHARPLSAMLPIIAFSQGKSPFQLNQKQNSPKPNHIRNPLQIRPRKVAFQSIFYVIWIICTLKLNFSLYEMIIDAKLNSWAQ